MSKWLILFTVLLMSSFALAHGWYPPECCSDADCRQVPCDLILENSMGYLYDGIQFTKESMKLSQDGFCHACFNQLTRAPHCLFGQFNN